MTFLNAALLFGLAAVVVPPVVHLFSRRKFDVVDWAAMRFLQLSQKTKRKVFFEQFWLMLLRVLLVALVVAAISAPQVTSRWLGTASGGGPRNVVILIDGSASMAYKQGDGTAADAAKRWTDDYLSRLRPGDTAAVFQVKHLPFPVQGTLTADREQVRNSLELLSDPKGHPDWPSAVQTAVGLLTPATGSKSVVILTDGQRYGWADENTLARWELVAKSLAADPANPPRAWVVNVAPERPPDPPNWSLDPITSTRAVAPAGRELQFRSALRFSGGGVATKPGGIKLEVDGRPAGEVTPPTLPTAAGQVALTFARKFPPGSHLLTLTLDPDDLPGDNHQDYAVEVLSVVPVLVVDGGPAGAGVARGSDYLRDALAPLKDPSPAFAVRVISASEFSPNSVTQDVKGPNTPPRVLVLANVGKLTTDQARTAEKFLNAGGSVLVTLGDRTDAATWNRIAFRGGQGFLPGRLVEVVGDEGKTEDAPKPVPASFAHPALDIFKEPLPGGLHTAYFPKRWKIDTAAGVNGSTGTAVALLSSKEPLLVERPFGKGRVILATHPLDNSWNTNLHRLPDFVRLAHELTYYLAGTRSAERNLVPGQPIVFTPRPEEPPGNVTVQSPDGNTRTLPAQSWPVVVDGTTDPGAYKLTTPAGRQVYFAVRTDPREAVLTPCTEEDRKKVADIVPGLSYLAPGEDATEAAGDVPVSQELWWLLLMIVVGLLVFELWYTRKLTSRGDHNLRTEPDA